MSFILIRSLQQTLVMNFLLLSTLLIYPVYSTAADNITLPVVTTIKAEKQQITKKVHVSGSLIARDELLINPQINGYEIKEIHVDIGDTVKKGDTLIVLDKKNLSVQLSQANADVLISKANIRQVKAQADSAKANLTKADADLKRNKSLGQAIPKVTLDDSRVAVDVAQAAYNSAKEAIQVADAQLTQQLALKEIAVLNLSRAEIKSPVDGVISERFAKLGDIASAGTTPLLKIIINGIIELEADVIETALPQIKKGDDAKITVAGMGEKAGKVRQVAPTIDPKTRLGKIRISLEKNANIRPGGFADGWVNIYTKEAIVVPASAIETTNEGDFVRVVDSSGVIEERKILAGILFDKDREVISGLEVGVSVLEKSGGFYKSGDQVSIQQ